MYLFINLLTQSFERMVFPSTHHPPPPPKKKQKKKTKQNKQQQQHNATAFTVFLIKQMQSSGLISIFKCGKPLYHFSLFLKNVTDFIRFKKKKQVK